MTACAGEKHGNGRAPSDRASYRDACLVHPNKLGNYRQPKPRTALAAGARGIGAIEWFEYAEKIFTRNTNPRVLNDELDQVVESGFDRDADMATARSVCDSVFQKVADDLLQRCCVAPHVRVRTFPERYLLFTVLCELREFFHHICYDCGEIYRRKFNALGPDERREREEVVDDL